MTMDLLRLQLNKTRFPEHIDSLPSARRRPARHPARARSELQPPGGLGPTPQSRHVTSYPPDSDPLRSREEVVSSEADEEGGEGTRGEGGDAHAALLGSPRWDWRGVGCAKLSTCTATKRSSCMEACPAMMRPCMLPAIPSSAAMVAWELMPVTLLVACLVPQRCLSLALRGQAVVLRVAVAAQPASSDNSK